MASIPNYLKHVRRVAVALIAVASLVSADMVNARGTSFGRHPDAPHVVILANGGMLARGCPEGSPVVVELPVPEGDTEQRFQIVVGKEDWEAPTPHTIELAGQYVTYSSDSASGCSLTARRLRILSKGTAPSVELVVSNGKVRRYGLSLLQRG